MANSLVTYLGQTGVTTDYVVPFGYIAQEDVTATVDGVSASFTWLNAGMIRMDTAPVGDLLIKRVTPSNAPVVTFVDGSTHSASKHNTQNLQTLYLAQEFEDNLDNTIASDGVVFEGQNKRIVNVADPVNDQDVVTKIWAETSTSSNVQQATAAKTAAENAQTAAEAAQVASESAQSSAESAQVASESARDAAQTAKTTSTAAAAAASVSATNASSSASTASAGATTATTKAGEADTSATNAAASAAAAAVSETNAAASAAAAATFDPAQYLLTTGKAADADKLDGLDSTRFLPFEEGSFTNLILNGDFSIDRDGGSTKTPGVGVYTFDIWKGHANGLEQIVEDLPAGEYTLIFDGGGTGYIGTDSGPSPLNATITAGDTSIVVPTTATKVMLLSGDHTSATGVTFKARPKQVEEMLLSRYYLPEVPLAGSGYATASGNTTRCMMHQQFPVLMRVTPTFSYVRITNNNVLANPTSGIVALNQRGITLSPETNNGPGQATWRGTITLDARF